MKNWWSKFKISKGWLIMYRIKKPFIDLKIFLLQHFTIYRVAFLFILISVIIWYLTKVTLDELWPNIIPELVSIAITVYIIDTLYQKRSDDDLKAVLIGKMGSKNNNVATSAWEEINARQWDLDGTLEGKFFLSANLDGNSFIGANMRSVKLSFSSLKNTTWIETDLSGAWLDHTDLSNATLSSFPDGSHIPEADLSDVSFYNANLINSRVRPEQLINVRTLIGATMPDGTKYDGRYRLPEDIKSIEKLIKQRVGDIENPVEIASYYGVPLKEYLAGQIWANAHPRLFSERTRHLSIKKKEGFHINYLVVIFLISLGFYLGTLDWKKLFTMISEIYNAFVK